MAYEMRDNSGNLFVNNNKTDDKHPAYKGQIKFQGQLWDLAVWTRRDRNNQAYWSFQLSEPRERAPRQDAPRGKGLPDDEIPF